MQTNFNKLYSSSPLIGLNYMKKLNHDLLESSKELPSVKLSKTLWGIFCFQPNYNKYCSFQLLSLNIKSKTKNKCSYEKEERVSLPNKDC